MQAQLKRILASLGLPSDHNYRLGVWNGWLVYIGATFLNPSIVLAGLVAQLGASNLIIALIPAIMGPGGNLPQALLVRWVARHERKIQIYRAMIPLRTLGLSMISLSALFLGHYPSYLLLVFILGMVLTAVGTSVSSLPFWETVAKTVSSKHRAAFFGARNLGGGALAFLAGILVRELLSLPLAFPLGYGLVFALGTLAFFVGWTLFGRVNEPAGSTPPVRLSFRSTWADKRFRAFFAVQGLFALAMVATPFYAAYAVHTFSATSALGLYLSLYTLAFVALNPLWVRISSRVGARSVIAASGGLGALATLLVMVLPEPLFGLVFILQGVFTSGLLLGQSTYLLNMAPAEQRSSYIGLMSTLVGALSLVGAVMGLLADPFGYTPLLVLTAALFAFGGLASRRLERVW